MLLNIVVDMLFNDMILRRATTLEQGNIDVLTKCIYMESTTSYVKGRGEGWGTDRCGSATCFIHDALHILFFSLRTFFLSVLFYFTNLRRVWNWTPSTSIRKTLIWQDVWHHRLALFAPHLSWRIRTRTLTLFSVRFYFELITIPLRFYFFVLMTDLTDPKLNLRTRR